MSPKEHATRSRRLVSAILIMTAFGVSSADATLVISNQATKNINCKNGTCKATAHYAVLNAGDLAGMLASGDVTVLPGLRAMDVELKVPLSWARRGPPHAGCFSLHPDR